MAKRLTKATRETIKDCIDMSARDNARTMVTLAELMACAESVQVAYRDSVECICESVQSDREYADYVSGFGRPLTGIEAASICAELVRRGY
jgi:hypothetical protein